MNYHKLHCEAMKMRMFTDIIRYESNISTVPLDGGFSIFLLGITIFLTGSFMFDHSSVATENMKLLSDCITATCTEFPLSTLCHCVVVALICFKTFLFFMVSLLQERCVYN